MKYLWTRSRGRLIIYEVRKGAHTGRADSDANYYLVGRQVHLLPVEFWARPSVPVIYNRHPFMTQLARTDTFLSRPRFPFHRLRSAPRRLMTRVRAYPRGFTVRETREEAVY